MTRCRNDSRHVNVNVGFTRVQGAVGRNRVIGAINQGWDGIGTLGNPRRILLIEEVEVGLGKVVTLLVQTQAVVRGRRLSVWDLIQGLDTRGGDVVTAAAEVFRQELGLVGEWLRTLGSRLGLGRVS